MKVFILYGYLCISFSTVAMQQSSKAIDIPKEPHFILQQIRDIKRAQFEKKVEAGVGIAKGIGLF